MSAVPPRPSSTGKITCASKLATRILLSQFTHYPHAIHARKQQHIRYRFRLSSHLGLISIVPARMARRRSRLAAFAKFELLSAR
eukprot:4073964-Pleurochrysis_carterae.AAC.1